MERGEAGGELRISDPEAEGDRFTLLVLVKPAERRDPGEGVAGAR